MAHFPQCEKEDCKYLSFPLLFFSPKKSRRISLLHDENIYMLFFFLKKNKKKMFPSTREQNQEKEHEARRNNVALTIYRIGETN